MLENDDITQFVISHNLNLNKTVSKVFLTQNDYDYFIKMNGNPTPQTPSAPSTPYIFTGCVVIDLEVKEPDVKIDEAFYFYFDNNQCVCVGNFFVLAVCENLKGKPLGLFIDGNLTPLSELYQKTYQDWKNKKNATSVSSVSTNTPTCQHKNFKVVRLFTSCYKMCTDCKADLGDA